MQHDGLGAAKEFPIDTIDGDKHTRRLRSRFRFRCRFRLRLRLRFRFRFRFVAGVTGDSASHQSYPTIVTSRGPCLFIVNKGIVFVFVFVFVFVIVCVFLFVLVFVSICCGYDW